MLGTEHQAKCKSELEMKNSKKVKDHFHIAPLQVIILYHA